MGRLWQRAAQLFARPVSYAGVQLQHGRSLAAIALPDAERLNRPVGAIHGGFHGKQKKAVLDRGRAAVHNGASLLIL
jgi:hypothetical protein